MTDDHADCREREAEQIRQSTERVGPLDHIVAGIVECRQLERDWKDKQFSKGELM